MSLRNKGQFRSGEGSFNMTPIIDMVFLLIIFFSVVCRFIERENFPVTVPDECKFAKSEPEREIQMTTVTVMKTTEDGVSFAVGPEKISASDYSGTVERLAELIDARLKGLPPKDKVVALRIDEEVCFGNAQYALAGVAASSATDIQLATTKDKRAEEE